MRRVAAVFAGPVMTLAGINHFVMPQAYASIVPDSLPAPMGLVYISGLAEIVGVDIAAAVPATFEPSEDRPSLVYATLTAVLAAAYVGLSVGLGALVPLAEDSPVVVTFSTLVVVTLFRPLRERIQKGIDQGFYRSKYDATRVVERFGDRLRHETNLPDLTSELCDVVVEAMRPAQVWLWMPGDFRPSEGRDPATAS